MLVMLVEASFLSNKALGFRAVFFWGGWGFKSRGSEFGVGGLRSRASLAAHGFLGFSI